MIALELDVTPGDIDAIEQRHSDPSDRLLEVLKNWLNKGTALWKEVVAALQSTTVDNEKIARDLESKFISSVEKPIPELHNHENNHSQQQSYKGFQARGSTEPSQPDNSTTSQIRDQKPDPPVEKETVDHMGKPQPKNVTHKSVELEWKRPSFGKHTIQFYSVLCYTHGDLDSVHSEKRTVEEYITVDGLSIETSYLFRVQAIFTSGIKLESELSDLVQTKPHLAETTRHNMSSLVAKTTLDKPALYELTKYRKMIDNQRGILKYEVGQPTGTGSHKVLLLVGATGSGKTTLINGIANYMYGVQWDDDFRFVLVNETEKKSQAFSQTSWIKVYTLHHGQGSPIPYSLTIIDLPTFGNADCSEHQKKLSTQIKGFFAVYPPIGIDVLHGIGFVVQASLTHLLPGQKYMIDLILSVCSPNLASSIFTITTFADSQDPPVMKAIAKTNIPQMTYFKFNNAALFSKGEEDSFDVLFWKLGMKSFNDFFVDFGRAEYTGRSLQLTREILDTSEQLEAALKRLQSQITDGLLLHNELQKMVIVLEQNKFIIEQNKDFGSQTVTTTRRKVNLPSGQHDIHCLHCAHTCLKNCTYSDEDIRYCSTMDTSGNCKVCSGRCMWTQHVSKPFRFEVCAEEEVAQKLAKMKERFDFAKTDAARMEVSIADIKEKLNGFKISAQHDVDTARKCLVRLDK